MNQNNRFSMPKIIFVLLNALLFMNGCGNGNQQTHQGQSPNVGTIILEPEHVVLETQLPGRTSAYLMADIRPQVNGVLQKRLFEEGSLVKAGDVLYQIDPAPYQAAVEQARAAVAMSEATLPSLRSREERFKKLLAINAVGQQDYDDAYAALQQAEAQLQLNRAALKTATINLSYTPIKAPVSGRIGKSSVTPGAMLTAYQSTPLAVIQQMDPSYVDVTQSAGEILQLRRNLESGHISTNGEQQNQVRLLLQDGTTYALAGTLQFRDVSVDATTGTVTLRIVFPNPDHELLPCMFVQAVVQEGVTDEGILVPQQAISRNPKGEPFAYVVGPDNAAEYRQLTLNREVDHKWLVTDGLSAGDRVIMDGLQSVRAGVSVNPVPWEPKAAPASGQGE